MEQKNAKNAKRFWPPGLCFFLFNLPVVAAATNDPASLDRLHDIVTPPPVSWWPPAPGWHVGAALLLSILLLLLIRFVSRYRASAYRRAALRELAVLEEANDWRELPVLLKRVALTAYPRAEVASLDGGAWLQFLDRTARMTEFSQPAGKQLVQLAYVGATDGSVSETKELLAIAARWIANHSDLPSSHLDT